jgi:hypothetical protein
MVVLDALNIKSIVLGMISKTSVLEPSVHPISKQNGVLIVAVPEKLPVQLLTDLRFVSGKKNLTLNPVSRDNIVAALHHFYATKPRSRAE